MIRSESNYGSIAWDRYRGIVNRGSSRLPLFYNWNIIVRCHHSRSYQFIFIDTHYIHIRRHNRRDLLWVRQSFRGSLIRRIVAILYDHFRRNNSVDLKTDCEWRDAWEREGTSSLAVNVITYATPRCITVSSVSRSALFTYACTWSSGFPRSVSDAAILKGRVDSPWVFCCRLTGAYHPFSTRNVSISAFCEDFSNQRRCPIATDPPVPAWSKNRWWNILSRFKMIVWAKYLSLFLLRTAVWD